MARNLQAEIDTAFNSGGGTVWLPKGTTVISSPLRMKSRVRLLGQGRLQSRIKIADKFQGLSVIHTDNFSPTINCWNYDGGKSNGPQPLYNEKDGLHIGFVIQGITIDGNRSKGAKVNGLCVYGGGYRVEDIGITDCDGIGFWSQCGKADNSWQGDSEYRYLNMHESIIKELSINCVTGHGVYFAGPNDSYLDKIQVKMAGEAGFYFEHGGTTLSSGGSKIGTIHAYSCSSLEGQIIIKSGGSSFDYIFTDTASGNGIKIDGDGNLINKILCMFHNRHRKTKTWGLQINGRNNYVGYYRYLNNESLPLENPPLHGGALQINSDYCSIPNGYLWDGGKDIKVKGLAVDGIGASSFKGMQVWKP